MISFLIFLLAKSDSIAGLNGNLWFRFNNDVISFCSLLNGNGEHNVMNVGSIINNSSYSLSLLKHVIFISLYLPPYIYYYYVCYY